MSDTNKDYKGAVYDYINTCKGLGCEPNIAILYSMIGGISGNECITDNQKDVTLIYKGYTGVYSPLHDGGFGGMIAEIDALVMFDANTLSDLKVQFELAVDDYLETCIELNYEPEVGTSSNCWPDGIDTTSTGNEVKIRMSNEHDADKLSRILSYIESSSLSVELFGAFIKEYAECKDTDQAWNVALYAWDCEVEL